MARGSHEGGSCHACTSVVPPFCIHHSTFCLRLGAAWTENGRPQGIYRKIRLHVNNQPTMTVNMNLGLDGAAVVRRRAPLENKRETRATQEQHKRSTRGTQESNSHVPAYLVACTWLVPGFGPLSAFCILHSAFVSGWLCPAFQVLSLIPDPAFCLPPSVALVDFASQNLTHCSGMGCQRLRQPRQPAVFTNY